MDKLEIITRIWITALLLLISTSLSAAPATLDFAPTTDPGLELSLVSLKPLLTAPDVIIAPEISLIGSINAVVTIPASLWLLASAIGASSCMRRVFAAARR